MLQELLGQFNIKIILFKDVIDKMKRKCYLFFMLILIFLGTTAHSNTPKPETHTPTLGLQEPSEVTLAISNSDGPTIGEPLLNNTSPNSNQAVNITIPINDEDGVQNATLFWEYASNGTLYNSTVNGTTRNNFVSEIGKTGNGKYNVYR